MRQTHTESLRFKTCLAVGTLAGLYEAWNQAPAVRQFDRSCPLTDAGRQGEAGSSGSIELAWVRCQPSDFGRSTRESSLKDS